MSTSSKAAWPGPARLQFALQLLATIMSFGFVIAVVLGTI
jgi:hypothetical protein